MAFRDDRENQEQLVLLVFEATMARKALQESVVNEDVREVLAAKALLDSLAVPELPANQEQRVQVEFPEFLVVLDIRE